MQLFVRGEERPIPRRAEDVREMSDFLKMLVEEHGLYDMWVVVARFEVEPGMYADDGNIMSIWMGSPPPGPLEENEVANHVVWPKT